MRTIHKMLIGGLGTALLAGAAFAATHEHVMTVKLKDGAVAHIAYFGDTPPKVQVVRGQPQEVAFADGFGSPFAEMDRISAMMNARTDQMMQQVAAMQKGAAAMQANDASHIVAFSNMPKDAHVHYSYTSTTVGADGCARTVSWTSNGATDAQPKMVKTSSGACDAPKDGAKAKPLLTAAPKAAETTPAHRI
jgi:hypothetical protein